jgi:transposase InsO family protein
MIAIAVLIVRMLRDCFKSRRRLEAEILVLRHQLNVLQQRTRRRLHLRWADRAVFIWLYRRCPRILDAITIVRPETVVRWHRKGFAAYWRWKSRSLGGRPQIGKDVRDLIRRMSFENPLWGATKIHGELLKLGIEVAQSTVSIYMVPRPDRPLQTWKTFVRNHMEGIASIDLFVVSTIAFEQLFAFLILGHRRRHLLWFGVTRNPTAEWLACQITEAFPWDRAPKYLIRDNDRAFGVAFKARVRAMGIRDRPTSFRSPWQNGYVERLIGSVRRECTNHLIVLNAEHLRRILSKYARYYNEVRTHVSLGKDAPYTRPIERYGNIVAHPILGGLHHRYARDLVFGSDSYFAMFWMAWRFAVRVTEPRSRARDRGEPSAVLLGYAAADDLWSQSALLL